VFLSTVVHGYGATLVPDWFSYVFTYDGNNHSLTGFLDAIELVMETGFALTALVAMLLNLTLADEIEETVAVEGQQTGSSSMNEPVSEGKDIQRNIVSEV
jgi:xanthine/uracil permease